MVGGGVLSHVLSSSARLVSMLAPTRLAGSTRSLKHLSSGRRCGGWTVHVAGLSSAEGTWVVKYEKYRRQGGKWCEGGALSYAAELL